MNDETKFILNQLDKDIVYCLWAVLLVAVKDIHSAQDNLKDNQWDLLTEMYDYLLQKVEEPNNEEPYFQTLFRLYPAQEEKAKKWVEEQNLKVATIQLESNGLNEREKELIRKSIEEGKPTPYYGAIGGGYTYSFCSTGVGEVVQLRNGLNGETIDLSEYNLW